MFPVCVHGCAQTSTKRAAALALLCHNLQLQWKRQGSNLHGSSLEELSRVLQSHRRVLTPPEFTDLHEKWQVHWVPPIMYRSTFCTDQYKVISFVVLWNFHSIFDDNMCILYNYVTYLYRWIYVHTSSRNIIFPEYACTGRVVSYVICTKDNKWWQLRIVSSESEALATWNGGNSLLLIKKQPTLTGHTMPKRAFAYLPILW